MVVTASGRGRCVIEIRRSRRRGRPAGQGGLLVLRILKMCRGCHDVRSIYDERSVLRESPVSAMCMPLSVLARKQSKLCGIRNGRSITSTRRARLN